MVKLVVKPLRGKSIDYLLNDQLAPHVLDSVVEGILRHYPADVNIDIVTAESGDIRRL